MVPSKDAGTTRVGCPLLTGHCAKADTQDSKRIMVSNMRFIVLRYKELRKGKIVDPVNVTRVQLLA